MNKINFFLLATVFLAAHARSQEELPEPQGQGDTVKIDFRNGNEVEISSDVSAERALEIVEEAGKKGPVPTMFFADNPEDLMGTEAGDLANKLSKSSVRSKFQVGYSGVKNWTGKKVDPLASWVRPKAESDSIFRIYKGGWVVTKVFAYGVFAGIMINATSGFWSAYVPILVLGISTTLAVKLLEVNTEIIYRKTLPWNRELKTPISVFLKFVNPLYNSLGLEIALYAAIFLVSDATLAQYAHEYTRPDLVTVFKDSLMAGGLQILGEYHPSLATQIAFDRSNVSPKIARISIYTMSMLSAALMFFHSNMHRAGNDTLLWPVIGWSALSTGAFLWLNKPLLVGLTQLAYSSWREKLSKLFSFIPASADPEALQRAQAAMDDFIVKDTAAELKARNQLRVDREERLRRKEARALLKQERKAQGKGFCFKALFGG